MKNTSAGNARDEVRESETRPEVSDSKNAEVSADTIPEVRAGRAAKPDDFRAALDKAEETPVGENGELASGACSEAAAGDAAKPDDFRAVLSNAPEEVTGGAGAVTVGGKRSGRTKRRMTAAEKKEAAKKETRCVLLMLLAVVVATFELHCFITPANFAPTGVEGVTIMLQYVTGLNSGWYSLIINGPLLIAALFILKKRYVIYVILFVVLQSLARVLFEAINFPVYHAEERLLVVLVAGVMSGFRSSIMLRIGSSTGGIEVAAGIVRHYRPHVPVEKVSEFLGFITILSSYFVYRDITSVLLSIVINVIYSRTITACLKDTRKAAEFKIVTKRPDEIKRAIIERLGHGATVVESKGAFSGDGSAIVFTVVNNRQIAEFMRLIAEYPDSFAYMTEASGVYGNFRWNKSDELR